MWIFLLMILSVNAQVVTEETPDAFFYMGVSDGKRDLAVALRDAYSEAVREAVMHQYGIDFSHSEVNATINDINHSRVDSDITTPTVSLLGIKPVREKIKQKEDGSWLVHRWISYDKNEIAKEKRRLTKNKKPSSIVKHEATNSILGSIEVISRPVGVRVILTNTDNNVEVIGTSPVIFQVPVGKYTMTLNQANYMPLTQDVIVSGQKTTVKPVLFKGMVQVELDIEPREAQVYYNGLPLKHRSLQLPVGEQTFIRVEHHDYETMERSFTPWFGENKTIEFDLAPKPGSVTLLTQPSEAEVFLEGKYLGRSPLLDQKLKPGRYQFEIKYPGFETQLVPIKILANKRIKPKTVILEKVKKRSIPSIDFSEPYQAFAFTYLPVIKDKTGGDFLYIPMHFEYRPFWPLGFQAFYLMTEKEDGMDIEKRSYQGAGARIYVLDYHRFRLSLGMQWVEYKTKKTKGGIYGKVLNAQKHQHWGVGADLEIPLLKHVGIKLTGHEYKNQLGRQKRYMLGVTFRF